MTSGLQEQKRELLFSKLDRNNDGAIDQSDIFAHIEGFLRDFNVPMDSIQAMDIRRSGAELWQLLSHADSDGDRVITKEEYAEAIDESVVERIYVSMNASFFRIIDVDGDGLVTEQELARALLRDGIDPEGVRAAFQRLDTDGDGHITKAEWDQATREMLLSSDPRSAGSMLLGL
ncbi:Ca2+-binding protein, EF-hand superfamily [Lentzea fradiae]|uniref:Ca2+-binding protein, EF-hand superfamily n=1 Tax=Lentzea fradiae TaxID=200378 RepID=A0A1G7L145_9PSEU|nr:EF-hand domain-containing protein [Lentzea fradiae]SDF43173.1 Ca2+-binding protein, EF-hand superfamily [Lentzea fradiae]